jgi:hypothetical protein
MLPVFKFMPFTSQTCENFTELKAVLCWVQPPCLSSLLPPFNNSMYSVPSTSSAATSVWQSAVSHHPHTGILTDCLRKNQMGEKLTVFKVTMQGWVQQQCIQILWWLQCGAHGCGLAMLWKYKHLVHCILTREINHHICQHSTIWQPLVLR